MNAELPPDRELDEELSFHVEQRIREYEANGMSPEQARAAAMQRMGELSDVRAECADLLARDRREHRWRERLTFSWLDFKLGFRMLARYPGLTVVGGLALAFGVWIGTCTFEASKQWLRPDLSLDAAHEVVGLQVVNTATGEVETPTLGDFVGWQSDLRSVVQLSAFRGWQANLLTSESAGEPVEVAEISPSAFVVARVPPHLGRVLVDADARPGAPAVLVLAHDVWLSRFAGDPAVIGRQVRLGARPATVVGVMPEGFAFPVYHQVWTALPSASANVQEPELRVRVFGRLADGMGLADAQREITELGERAARAFPDTHEHLRPQVVAYASSILSLQPEELFGLRWMNLVVGMLVALVCGNVALLLFARAATRESEIVVRNALGAGRSRIVAQLFVEALVLASLGTLLGLGAARSGMRFLLFLLTENLGKLPYWVNADLSLATWLYAALLTILGAGIAGVLPALRVTRAVGPRLRQAGPGGGGVRFAGVWTAVIVGQVAVTVAFPAAALMIWRAGEPLRSFDVGFDESELLAGELVLGESEGTPASSGPDARTRRFQDTLDELARRLSAAPEVAGVAFANRLPRMFHPEPSVEVLDGDAVAGDSLAPADVKTASVDPRYLELLGARILAGRGFREGDGDAGEPVVVVNEAFVREVLGGQNAVGRRIRLGDSQGAEAPAPYEIVGVASDVGMYHEGGRAGVYLPLEVGSGRTYALVKVRGSAAAFVPGLRALATAVDPTLQVHELAPMNELAAGIARLVGTMVRSALFASGVALLLSLATIYSVMAFAVARRTREIGVRIALGADARRLLLSVFRRPLTQVGLGVVLGGALVGLLVRAVLGGMALRELAFVIVYAALMMGVCSIACVVPTRRALRIEPTEALREET